MITVESLSQEATHFKPLEITTQKYTIIDFFLNIIEKIKHLFSCFTARLPKHEGLLDQHEYSTGADAIELTTSSKPHDTPPLANFRQITIQVGDQTIQVAGMRHPDTHGLPGNEEEEAVEEELAPQDVPYGPGIEKYTIGAVTENLKGRGFSVMISLEDRKDEEIAAEWIDEKCELHQEFIIDFHPMQLPSSISLCNLVKQAAMKGNNVVFHCGEGWGRSGAALATIVLMTLLREEKLHGRLSLEQLVKDSSIALKDMEKTQTSELIARAIEIVRALEHEDNFCSTEGISVEKHCQVRALEQFQEFLTRHPRLIWDA